MLFLKSCGYNVTSTVQWGIFHEFRKYQLQHLKIWSQKFIQILNVPQSEKEEKCWKLNSLMANLGVKFRFSEKPHVKSKWNVTPNFVAFSIT